MVDMREEHKRLSGDDILTETEIVSRADRRIQLSGIYFLVKDGRIVYVGQAQDVDVRIAQHRKTKDFDEFTYIQAMGDQLDLLESIYIHHFRPELNARRGGKIVAPLDPSAVAGTQVKLQALAGVTLRGAKERRGDVSEAVLDLDAI